MRLPMQCLHRRSALTSPSPMLYRERLRRAALPGHVEGGWLGAHLILSLKRRVVFNSAILT